MFLILNVCYVHQGCVYGEKEGDVAGCEAEVKVKEEDTHTTN